MKFTRKKDQPNPKLVRKHLGSIEKFKKYCAEPVCLECGYDLRGLVPSGRTACPECGRSCTLNGVVRYIGRAERTQNPVWMQVGLGLFILTGGPVLGLMLTVPVAYVVAWVCRQIGFKTLSDLQFVGGTFLLIGGVFVLAWVVSIGLARQVFGGPQGIWIWGLAQVLMVGQFFSLFGLIAWLVGWALALGKYGHQPPPRSMDWDAVTTTWPVAIPLDNWPINLLMLLNVVLLWMLRRWNRRLVHRPCQARCARLARRWLRESEAYRDTQSSAG